MKKVSSNCCRTGIERVKKFIRFGPLWAGVFLALVVLVFIFQVYRPFVAGQDVFFQVNVGGADLTGLGRAEALATLQERFEPLLDRTLTFVDNKTKEFICQPREWGFSFDYRSMLAEAFAPGHTGNVFVQWMNRRTIKSTPVEKEIKILTDQMLLAELIRLLEIQVNVEAVKSQITVKNTGEVEFNPGRLGRRLNSQRFLAELSKVLIDSEQNRLTLPIDVVMPSLVKEEVSQWNLTKVISIYTTEFDESDENRTNNLMVAVSLLHGALLPSGQQFSFNRWIGPRDLERGYKEASVVLDNELIAGLGGGVCQVSTTLYNAWLLAGLNVDKRFNHSMPVSYVEMGRDAAVVYGAQDLVFSNSLKTPLLISACIEDEMLTIALLGDSEDRQEYALEPKIVEEILPQQVRKEDDSLEAGVEIIEEHGRSGYKVELWRKVFREIGRAHV